MIVATAVYDCMIFLQAAARPGREHGTLRLAREGTVQLCVSPAIIAELRDVLTRPEVTARFPALTSEHVDAFLADVLSFSLLFSDVPKSFSLPRDAKDEPYLDLAIVANAGFLVTWNERHLTYLMRGDTPEGRDFLTRFPNLQILDPPSFVRVVMQSGSGG